LRPSIWPKGVTYRHEPRPPHPGRIGPGWLHLSWTDHYLESEVWAVSSGASDMVHAALVCGERRRSRFVRYVNGRHLRVLSYRPQLRLFIAVDDDRSCPACRTGCSPAAVGAASARSARRKQVVWCNSGFGGSSRPLCRLLFSASILMLHRRCSHGPAIHDFPSVSRSSWQESQDPMCL
jgi:hypothetical protein